MKAVRFHTVVGEDQVIRIPTGSPVPAGEIEVIVLQPEDKIAGKEAEANGPRQQTTTTAWPLVQRLARIAEELGVHDLPTDLSANHDHYAHGAPKGIDEL